MRKYIVVLILVACCEHTIAQTNTFPTSGNVGIGTLSPISKFNLTGGKFIINSDDGSYGQLQVNANNSGSEATILLSSGGTGINNGGYTNTGVIGMGAYGNSRSILVFGTGYNGGTMFLNNNNVGIGTNNPESKLHVAGDFKVTNGSATWDNLHIWSDGVSSYIQSNGDEEGLHIKSNAANKIILESNVGIGTTNPGSYKLAVEGTIGARKLKVTQNTWADIVFKKGYKLMPLSILSNYIIENGHLPEVPTEKQVKGKDIDVAETQALLLKKIEELTLYLIDQSVVQQNLLIEVKALKSANIKMKNQIKKR